jgi:hypothetical protein
MDGEREVMMNPVDREWIERKVLVPLLVLYVVTLGWAAWRHEIRPAIFDGVSEFARRGLAIAGIPPGVAVFSADTATAPDAKIAAICPEVRGLSADGAQTRLYPGEGIACPAPSPRFWVHGEDIFLHRALVSLRAATASRQRDGGDRRGMRFARLLAGSVGAHFVASRHAGAADSERMLLLWQEARVSYESGDRSERVVALFEWHNAPNPRVSVAWRPDPARLRERGWTSEPP